MVERLFLAVPRGCLQFVIVVFPDHTHLVFLYQIFITVPYWPCREKIFFVVWEQQWRWSVCTDAQLFAL